MDRLATLIAERDRLFALAGKGRVNDDDTVSFDRPEYIRKVAKLNGEIARLRWR